MPGGARLWKRTNHRGEPVTVLLGPAAVLATATGVYATPGLSERDRLAAVVAAGGRGMIGWYGANALGAALGVAVVARAPRSLRLVLLTAVSGLVLASERVSFTSVIEALPTRQRLDRLGRRHGEPGRE